MSSREIRGPPGNILETSYGLVEDEKMSSKWRNMQCLLFIVSAVSGLVFYCTFSAVRKELSDACIVNVKLVFQKSNPDVIDEISSNWGSTAVCDFCSYTPLICSVLALVLLVYFIMSGPGGRGSAGSLAQPWRIVMPTILFSLLAFSVVFTTTWLTYFGRIDFCKQIDDRNVTFPANMTSEDKKDAEIHIKLIRLAGCKTSGNLTNVHPNATATPEYSNLLSVVEIAGLIDSTSWCLGFLLVLTRFLLMPDFRLLRFDFILESGGKKSPKERKTSQASGKWSDAVDPRGSVQSSDSALSTAQTALTSLDQNSLKHRSSNPPTNDPALRRNRGSSPPHPQDSGAPTSVEKRDFPLPFSSPMFPLSPPKLYVPRDPIFRFENDSNPMLAREYLMKDRILRLCW